MTLLEYAEKISPLPLMGWQKEFLQKYEEAKKNGKELIFIPGRNIGRTLMVDIINQFYGKEMKDVYCQGTKKNGIPCKRYLGKVSGKAELLCPICKTVNVVEDGRISIKEKICGKKN